MGVDVFLETVLRHRRILVDTSTIVYFLNSVSRYEAPLKSFFSLAEQGKTEVVVSLITEVELLVGPMKKGDEESAGVVKLFLSKFPNLEVVAVSRDIGYRAARLRVRTGLRLPDAIILATGIVSGCGAAVGNDRSWARVEELPFLCLDDLL